MATAKSHRPSSRSSVFSTSFAYEQFNSSKQLRRMLFLSLLRWLVTLALAGSIYGVLWSYSQNKAMPSRKKNEFNTLVIGLSIVLGLNIASSLKADVGELRWWLLSLHQYSPQETDLILQSENLSRLVMLAWKSRLWAVHIFVLVFVVLNVASQVALALLGITYNINPADKYTVTRPGAVSIPDMSDVQTEKVLAKDYTTPQALNARRYTANSFGLVALSLSDDIWDHAPMPGTVFSPDNPMLFVNEDEHTYHYVFYESTPRNASYYAMVATNRSVSAHAECDSWPVIKGGRGLSENITIRFENGTTADGVLPATNGPDQTMFLNDPTSDSGDTWAIVAAFEASRIEPWFYLCNVSINLVVNAVIKEHFLGVNVTQFAAPAIALQGYGASSTGYTNDTKPFQFQSYPAQSVFGAPQNGSTVNMAVLMARFAIGSIAVTALSNNNIDALGMVPLKGITLEVNRWGYVHLILGLTVGIQLFIAVISVLVANRVQVRCHSHLSMTALLRPAMQGVSYRASAATGQQIADMMGKDVRLTYIPERSGGYHIWHS